MTARRAGDVVVFAGPTLSAGEVLESLACVVLPPARQGDVWRAVRTYRPATIGLIDGVFLDVPAVWHRELLWALAQGIAVWGAASMGALRAAELRTFGMHGVGRVFEAFRDGIWPGFPEPFEDDDEVAVAHAPAEIGGAALTNAMVDLRATLLEAVLAGVIDRAACLDLASAMKRLHFPQRSVAALAMRAPPALRAWLPRGAVAQKRLDAVAMLQAMAAVPAAPASCEPGFRFERAFTWEHFETQALRAERRERSLILDGDRGTLSLRSADGVIGSR